MKDNMATNTGKRARREKQEGFVTIDTFKEVKPLNFIQEAYLNAIKHNDIIFGIGSAGTGKTYVPAAFAASELYHKRIERVIITRPNIEVGRSLGFLPGTLDEKFLPYLKPFEKVFRKFLGSGFYEYAIKTKSIDPQPLGFLRGETFEDCIVLVDEAQNITGMEFKMILTRIGKNCKMIISGDSSQSDIPDSGLDDTLDIIDGIQGIEIVEFLDSDIVRSRLCKHIIQAYNR
jgi:phosphate starvation-inducible protein PhoH and related proteins